MDAQGILVCVTIQESCARLIRRGRELAVQHFLPLQVIHVSSGKTMMGNSDVSEALNTLYAEARACDAELEILYSHDVRERICRYAIEKNIRYMVLGKAKTPASQKAFEDALHRLLPDVEFVFVAEEE